ncbi:MAG: LysR family transcriptional regulator [Sneathiella sp.]|nr:LysR family transcriptional regulator [Sneathiella sp.]
MEWSDLKIFLAVAQTGSLRQAARMLQVTQPTVSRRLRSLEADLGIPLFDRAREGHFLTRQGQDLLPHIRAVESAAQRVEQFSLKLVGDFQETVRIEAGETAASILAERISVNPKDPKIELVVTGLPQTETGRKADIKMFHGMPADGRGLTRRVGSVTVALYGNRQFAKGRALPLSDEDISTLPWIGFVEEQEHYITMEWLWERMRGRAPVARLMNLDLMMTAASRGIGVTVLPCYKGGRAEGLVRLTAPIEELLADYWILVDPDLAKNPAIRSTINWIIECFQAAELKESL